MSKLSFVLSCNVRDQTLDKANAGTYYLCINYSCIIINAGIIIGLSVHLFFPLTTHNEP